MKLFLMLLLFCGSLCAEDKEKKVEMLEKNFEDNIECQWEKDSEHIAKNIGDKDYKKEDKSACKGEKKPLAKRLDNQLKKDAKKIKDFFGFD